MLSLLNPYWDYREGVSFSGANAVLVKSRTRDEFRIAYHRPGETRWHLSPVMSETFGKTIIIEARRDASRGETRLTGTRHMLKIYARERMPALWRQHRKQMEQRREEAAIRDLPTFGVF